MSKRRKRRKLTAEEKNSKEYDMPGIRRWRALQSSSISKTTLIRRAPILLIPDMQGWALDVLQDTSGKTHHDRSRPFASLNLSISR